MIIIVLLTAFSLIACTAKKEVKSNPTAIKDNDNHEKDIKSEKVFPELQSTVNISLPYVKYSIDVPHGNVHRAASGFLIAEKTYSIIYDSYVDPASKLIYNVDIDKINKIEDVFDQMKTQILENAKTRLISASEYTFAIESSKIVNVNNWEMNRIIGKIKLSEEYKLKYDEVDFALYCTIIQGYPIYIIVIDDPLSEEAHTDIIALADKISKTFKNNME